MFMEPVYPVRNLVKGVHLKPLELPADQVAAIIKDPNRGIVTTSAVNGRVLTKTTTPTTTSKSAKQKSYRTKGSPYVQRLIAKTLSPSPVVVNKPENDSIFTMNRKFSKTQDSSITSHHVVGEYYSARPRPQLQLNPMGSGYRGVSHEMYRNSPRSSHQTVKVLTKSQNNFLTKLNRQLNKMLIPHSHLNKTADYSTHRTVSILESTPLSATLVSTDIEITRPMKGIIGRKASNADRTLVIDSDSLDQDKMASRKDSSRGLRMPVSGTSNRSNQDDRFVLSSGLSEIRVSASPAPKLKTEFVAAYGVNSKVVRRVALDLSKN